MSWNFKLAGNKEDVKAAVNAEQYCPAEVRAAICALVDSRDLTPFADGKPLVVYAQSDGHVDNAYAYGKFEVNRVQLAGK